MAASQTLNLAPDLKQVWANSRRSFLALGAFSACINLLWLVPTLYMMQVYDRVLTSGSAATLLMLSLISLFLLATMGMLEWVRSMLLVRLGERLHGELARRLFDVSYRQSLATSGQQATAQPLADLQGLRQFLTGSGLSALFDLPWLPFFVLLLFAFHPAFGLLSLSGAALLLSIAVLQERRSASLLLAAGKDAGAAQAGLVRTLANADAIEGLGMAARLGARWDSAYQRVLGAQTRASERSAVLAAASRVLRVILQSSVLGTGAWLVLHDRTTGGVMVAGSVLLGRALAPIDQLTAQWKFFVVARGQLRRLNDWLLAVPEPAPRMVLPAPVGNVAVEGLVVVPPGAQVPALRGLTFHVEAGQIVGIVGPSTAGKSTLARALLGIWSPVQGRVRLDGAEIHGRDRSELGPHLGYLPQDVELFDGTVAENIARFGAVEPEQVVAAARLAGVHEMILRLPHGYDTQVGAVGGALTAGQRQRLGLARAVYGNPRLIVLDEPNSNLDEAGDAALLKALLALKERGATVFVVSHRAGVVPALDKLLVLRDGQLVALGTPEEVNRRLQDSRSGTPLYVVSAAPCSVGGPA